jgi:hypothetical protein
LTANGKRMLEVISIAPMVALSTTDPSRCCHGRQHDTEPLHVNLRCLSEPSDATADVSRETNAKHPPWLTRAANSMYLRASAYSRAFRLSEHRLAHHARCSGSGDHGFHTKRGEWPRGQAVTLPAPRRRVLDRLGGRADRGRQTARGVHVKQRRRHAWGNHLSSRSPIRTDGGCRGASSDAPKREMPPPRTPDNHTWPFG